MARCRRDGYLDVDENIDGEDSASVLQVEPLGKVKLLKTLIPLLHEMHDC